MGAYKNGRLMMWMGPIFQANGTHLAVRMGMLKESGETSYTNGNYLVKDAVKGIDQQRKRRPERRHVRPAVNGRRPRSREKPSERSGLDGNLRLFAAPFHSVYSHSSVRRVGLKSNSLADRSENGGHGREYRGQSPVYMPKQEGRCWALSLVEGHSGRLLCVGGRMVREETVKLFFLGSMDQHSQGMVSSCLSLRLYTVVSDGRSGGSPLFDVRCWIVW